MAVVTIDAKAELAQIQAAIDAEEGQAPPPSVAEALAEPAEKKAEPSAKRDDDDDEPDFAEQLGLTPAQHEAFTKILTKRIGKKVRETREAEEFAAAQYSERKLAEARAAALEQENAKLKESQGVPRETTDPEAGKPKREKFATDEAYWDAVIDWRADQRADKKIKEQRALDAAAAAERQQAEIARLATSRVSKAIELMPDFQEKVVDRANDIWIPDAIKGYMERSELMPELAYHFAEHPEVLEKLGKLPPDEQLVTIGKIESTLKPFGSSDSKGNSGATPSTSSEQPASRPASSEAGTSPSRARSSAPVITPLNGNGAAGGPVDPASMNIREHIADFQKRQRVNLGLRKRH